MNRVPRRHRARSSRFAYVLLFVLMLSVAIALVAATGGGSLMAQVVAPATATIPATSTLSPTWTPAVSPTPSATITQSATPTASPTVTPTPTITPSPTATLTPSITPTFPPTGRFTGAMTQAWNDCSRTVVQGTVHDGLLTLDGVLVRVWWPEAPPDQIFSLPSGSNPALGPGGYEVTLDARPRAGWWLVAVVNESGALQGDAVVVETTEHGCEDGTGRQVVRVDFQRGEGTLGVPGPTLTPTATATPTITPTPLPTPDGVSRTMKVPILMYHYISAPPAGSDSIRRDLSVSPDVFRAQLITLREQGYTSITLAQLLYAIQLGQPLPPRPIVLTFDDGYRDNYEQAFQIMRQEGFVGTFFVVTNLVEERNVNYMTWEQLVEMSQAGMEIASHTASHPSLPGMAPDKIWRELYGSRQLLEQRLGREVRSIAYPTGRFDAGVAHLAHEAGYWIGVTTKQGVTHSNGNLLTLRRIRVRGGWFPPRLMEAIHFWMVEATREP